MNRNFLRTALIAGGTALISATAVYAGEVRFFNDHYLPGTIINDTDYTSMSSHDVVADLREQTEDYRLNVRFRDGSSVTVRAADVGLSYYDDGTAGRILQEQDAEKWPLAIFFGDRQVVSPTYLCDDARVDSFLSGLPQLQAENMAAPEDARVEYSGKDQRFVVVRENEGSTIEADQLRAYFTEALCSGERELDLSSAEGVYAEPKVRSDDEGLIRQAEQLNDLLQGSITYELPYGETMVIDGSVCRGWLGRDGDGNYYYDENKWEQNVQKIADKLENKGTTVWEPKHFHATYKGDITVPGGTYGYILNRDEEVNALRSFRTSGKYVSRKPSYYAQENGSTLNDGIGDTYVEVDIDNQHMWYYKSGKLILETDVVTGTTDGKHNTPKGVWTIQWKEPNATLIGELKKNGKPEYKTKVGYWMPFYDGCGFHDAWWRYYFGGTIYTYSGSHGCVNMPVDMAAKLFDTVDAGTVVVIY